MAILPSGAIPSDLYTSELASVRRIAVDQQQTSFEDNAQFRFFDTYDSVSQSSQIVYKLTTTDAIVVQERMIGLYAGGRTYRVYAFDNGETFTGTLADAGSITPLNRILNEYNETHPETGVTIQKAVGAGIFSAGTSIPYTGQTVLTDGNSNRAASNYSPESLRSGISANTSIWIVMEHIGANNDTSGEYELSWEERYGE